MSNNTTIRFGARSAPAEATFPSPQAFTIYMSAFDIDWLARNPDYTDYETNLPGHQIKLYSKHSNSSPWQESRNRWSILCPQWHFTDLSGNKIDYLQTTDKAIYNSSNEFIGVTGEASFYYTDDMPTAQNEYVLLIATLMTSAYELSADNTKQYEPSYANSRSVAYLDYSINAQVPGKLKVTRNALSGESGYITSPKWVGVHVPHIITVHGNLYADDVCSNSYYANLEPLIFSYPATNSIGLKYPIERYIWPLDSQDVKIPTSHTSSQVWSPTATYFTATDTYDIRKGGYCISDVIPVSDVHIVPFVYGVSSIPSVVGSEQAKYMDYIGASNPTTIHFSADQMDYRTSSWAWDLNYQTTYLQSSANEFITHTYSNFISSTNTFTIIVSGWPDSIAGTDSILISSFNLTFYPSISGYGASIIAAVSAEYDLVWRNSPFVWVSNPNNKTINRIYYPGYTVETYPLIPPGLSGTSLSSVSMSLIPSAEIVIYDVPYIGDDGSWKDYYSDNMDLSGFGGIYGIAVNKCYDVWAVDPEQDYLLKFQVDGSLLLKTRIEPSGCSPMGIALDGNSNLWVTLYGSSSTIKFDYNGDFTNIVAVPNGYDPNEIVGGDDIRYRPVGVDTDTLNNIWVAYENFIESALIKYNTNGVQLLSCSLPLCAQPQDVIVDPIRNACWVTNSYEAISSVDAWNYWRNGTILPGSVQLWGSDGILLSSYGGFDHPDYITMDRSLGVWFTFGYHSVGHITSGGDITTFIVSATEFVSYASGDFYTDYDIFSLEYNETLQGIACDAKNRIWIINSLENRVYVVSADTTNYDQQTFTSFKIRPDNNLAFFNESHVSESNEWFQSAQAFGDWTGYRWLQKYYPYYPTTTNYSYISGVSNEFLIKRFNEEYDIRKFNDSWSPVNTLKEYMLPQHLRDNPQLFDLYLNSMAGNASLSSKSILRQAYERTANFTKNHMDVDECGIDQLYSLSNELDVPIDNYNFSYPPDIKNYMNLFSIAHSKLWGARCGCNQNINPNTKSICPWCSHNHTNIGNFLTAELVGGDFLIQQNKSTETYELTSIPPGSTFSTIQSDEYLYFEYIPTICGVQVEGVIDWDSKYTTLNESESSIAAWYGPGGILEEILNYNLRLNIFGGLTY